MSTSLLLIGAIAMFLAVFAIAYSVQAIVAERRQAYRTIQAIRAVELRPTDLRNRELARPARERLLKPFYNAALGLTRRFTPAGAREAIRRTLIMAGFVVTAAGIVLLLALVGASSRVVAFAPGLLLIGLGLGVMLTPSVNVVQSSFPEALQGEISGLSRSVSNLGSSFGTAIAGTILVSDLASGNRSYVLALISLAVIGLAGLGAALLLPAQPAPQRG